MTSYNICGIGAALVDTEIQVSDADLDRMAVDKGMMTLVDAPRQQQLNEQLENHLVHAKRASGGSACNSIFAASCFGAKNFYSCKVADDDGGQFFLNDLQQAGVQCNAQDHGDGGATGKCLVLITPDAERSMNTHLGISESFSSAQLNPAAIKAAEYLYIEGYLVTSETGRAAAIEARGIAEQHQVKTAISLSDPAMVQFFKDGLQAMIGTRVDLLFCNEDEARAWTGEDDIAAIGEKMQQTATTFAITRGDRGAVVYDGERFIDIAAVKIDAVDSNGAGDMFAGAFLYAITHGHSFEKAGKLASLAAATVVSRFGPRLPQAEHSKLLTALG